MVITSSKELDSINFSSHKESIMHLFLVKSIEIIAGTKAINCKEVPPDQNKGFISSSLPKGDPPDAHILFHINHPKYFGQGKFLNSYLCRDTNLLYLGAGDIVSRTKPFQGGENDASPKSSTTKEHAIKRHEVESMKLRRAKETYELSSAQMKAKVKDPSSTNIWRFYSIHSEPTTKKNQSKRSSDEEVIEDTTWHIFSEPGGDMRSLIKTFRPDQDEPRTKSNLFGFSTHQRQTTNLIRSNPSSDQGDINFTNRVNRNFPDLDPGVLIGGFRSNQEESSYKPTCYGILTQPGISSNWIHDNSRSGLKVIPLLNKVMLHLPYLEAHGLDHFLNRLWRPGETSNLQGDTSNRPGEPAIIFPCTSIYRIRRILLLLHFPYMAAFTLEGITLQRLVNPCFCVLETYSMHLDVPRHQTFTPKLSRFKPHHKFPYLAKTIKSQRLDYQDHIF